MKERDLYYRYKIHDENPHKFSYLPGIINCLLNKNRLDQANYYFEEYESRLIHKEQLMARFALAYIERDNQSMLDSILKKLPDSSIKKFILVVAGSRYPEYDQENIPEDLESLMSDDEFIDLAQPS